MAWVSPLPKIGAHIYEGRPRRACDVAKKDRNRVQA